MYKRQKWDTSCRVIILTLLEKGSEIGVLLAAQPEKESPVSIQAQDDVSVLMIPVSYTHLDVYKRQMWMWMPIRI